MLRVLLGDWGERYCSHGQQTSDDVCREGNRGRNRLRATSAEAAEGWRAGRPGALRRWRAPGAGGARRLGRTAGLHCRGRRGGGERRVHKGSGRPGTRPGPSLTTCLLEKSYWSPGPGTPGSAIQRKGSASEVPRESGDLAIPTQVGVSRARSAANMAAARGRKKKKRESLLRNFEKCASCSHWG